MHESIYWMWPLHSYPNVLRDNETVKTGIYVNIMHSGTVYTVYFREKMPTIWQNQNNCTVNGYGESLRDDPAITPLPCKQSALQAKQGSLRWSLYVSFVTSLSARKHSVADQNQAWHSIQGSPFPQHPKLFFFLRFHNTEPRSR